MKRDVNGKGNSPFLALIAPTLSQIRNISLYATFDFHSLDPSLMLLCLNPMLEADPPDA